MARSLASILYKGIAAVPAASTVSGSFYQRINRFSTSVPSDSDTHEDFRPTTKVTSDNSLKDIVEQDIKENPVMIYMKGVPELPRCGFSALAVRVLREYSKLSRTFLFLLSDPMAFADVPLGSRNILEDLELKNAVKSFSHWPTFPQIFINGEFVGGSDIILNMHQAGELKEKLKADTEKQQ
ncbi:hypothetical protein SASPL_118391 [Salvia splendens]|uniref:Glutaredoxin domain-containing protein n=1 Tax=Salvia splendens TaxID=180675 RepID=A0A8X8Y1J5_SALSN|nr:hypothetical protein SASPL_118391 [Salvia splendens]